VKIAETIITRSLCPFYTFCNEIFSLPLRSDPRLLHERTDRKLEKREVKPQKSTAKTLFLLSGIRMKIKKMKVARAFSENNNQNTLTNPPIFKYLLSW